MSLEELDMQAERLLHPGAAMALQNQTPETHLVSALVDLAHARKIPRLRYTPVVVGYLAPLLLTAPLLAPSDEYIPGSLLWILSAQFLLGVIALTIWARRRVDTSRLRGFLRELVLGTAKLENPKRSLNPEPESAGEKLLALARQAERMAGMRGIRWQLPVVLFFVNLLNFVAMKAVVQSAPNTLPESPGFLLHWLLVMPLMTSLVLWAIYEGVYSQIQFVDQPRVFFLRLLQQIPDAEKPPVLRDEQARLERECRYNLLLDVVSPGNRMAFAGGAVMALLGGIPVLVAHYFLH